MTDGEFVHLHVHSPFSFLDGADAIETIVKRAAELDMPALALTDHDNVSGAVRFTRACQAAGIQPIIGAELTIAGSSAEAFAGSDTKLIAGSSAESRSGDGPESITDGNAESTANGRAESFKNRRRSEFHLTALATSPAGYANLCRLLTAAHLHNERGRPQASWDDIVRYKAGIVFLSGCMKGEIPTLLQQRRYAEAKQVAKRYVDTFGRDHFFFELGATELPGQHKLNRALVQLAQHLQVATIAAGNVHYARQKRHPVHDVLRCIAAGISLDEPDRRRPFNDQLYLLSPAEMKRRFAWHPKAVTNTVRLAERCTSALIFGQPRHPRYPLPAGQSADGMLHQLTWAGAQSRYGSVGAGLRARIEEELAIIGHLAMADYFLVAWDAVQFAKKRGIRTSGRGSAVDSVVAYCLGLTDVDAYGRGLGFERFLSVERGEPPDIDIDIEAERRDEVAAYVYERYGQEKVAAVATYHTYHARGALRDVGKTLGFSQEEIDALAKRMPSMPADAIERALDHYPELRDRAQRMRTDALRRRWLELADALAGLPRHLGTHSSGLVISAHPLTDVTPLQMSAKGVAITQFDKDDVEALGLMKLDLLFLRILGAVNTTANAIRQKEAQFDYDRIPADDGPTYARLRRGETIGVFQLESPAQRALHPRLRPDSFEDIVASVALIRPGPVKGEMVNPFIARRNGEQPITYVHPLLEPILKKTYGVVLFQEQIIEIARTIAGFTPGEADQLRRAMSSFRSQKEMDRIGRQFIAKAIERGCAPDVAETIFGYISSYAGYGFCEAHAASFATTAYKTAYLLEHYPAEFFAALLSHQPMGYYPPNTLLWNARHRGVAVRGLCINKSERGWIVEQDGALRIALSQVRGLSEKTLTDLLAAREEKPFTSFADFCSRVPSVTADEAKSLILGGAFDELHANRRALLWQLPAVLKQTRLARERQIRWDAATWGKTERHEMMRNDCEGEEDFSPFERDMFEFQALGLTKERHIIHHWRPLLKTRGARSCAQAATLPHGHPVTVGGLCIRPHRPPTKSGRTVVFLTLEDETGIIDVTVFEHIYMRYGKDLFVKPLLLVGGVVERRGQGVSITARHLAPLESL